MPKAISSDGSYSDAVSQEGIVEPSVILGEERQRTLEALLAYLKSLGIFISKDGVGVGDDVLEKVLARCLPRPSSVENGYVEKQLEAGIEEFKKKLEIYRRENPGLPLELKGFVVLAYKYLSNERIDGYTLDAYLANMGKTFVEREKLTAELKAQTAELEIYSKIQSHANATLAKGEGAVDITRDLDLLDRTLYGYAPTDDKWLESAEYKFMKALDTGKNNTLSIKEFLVGGPKESGVIGAGQLQDVYNFSKENNPIASFATMVNDRMRPVNDKVQETTVLLKDVTDRYNSAIEAIKRFIDKFASVMSEILRSI